MLPVGHRNLSRSLVLEMNFNSVNFTLGPKGILPSALVFGEFPQIRTAGDTVHPVHNSAARASGTTPVRFEIYKYMAQPRPECLLRHDVPPGSNVSYQPGDQVHLWL